LATTNNFIHRKFAVNEDKKNKAVAVQTMNWLSGNEINRKDANQSIKGKIITYF